MKQLKKNWIRTNPLKSLFVALLAALPLIASASTAGMFGTDALLSDAPLGSAFDWPRFSLLAAGVIALVRARSSATTNALDDINAAGDSSHF